MNARPLHAAIVGYGHAGAVFHAPLIAATRGMEVAAIVTRDSARRTQAKRDHPGAAIHNTAEAIWQDAGRYDLVVVAAPNRVHAALGAEALRAGLPVVVEKPLASSVAEAEALLDVARQTGVLLTVFHNRRWDDDFLTVRHLLEQDALGPVARLESRYDRYRPVVVSARWRESDAAEDAGGLLFDLGPHLVDQALLLFGRPAAVYAELHRRRPGARVDDDTFVSLLYPGGPGVHLGLSMLAAEPAPRFRVVGQRGTYESRGLDPQEEALRRGARPGDPGWGMRAPEQRGVLSTCIDGAIRQETVASIPGAYEEFYARLRDAVLAGTAPPVDPLDALEVLRVIEAARASASAGAAISLEASVSHLG